MPDIMIIGGQLKIKKKMPKIEYIDLEKSKKRRPVSEQVIARTDASNEVEAILKSGGLFKKKDNIIECVVKMNWVSESDIITELNTVNVYLSGRVSGCFYALDEAGNTYKIIIDKFKTKKTLTSCHFAHVYPRK